MQQVILVDREDRPIGTAEKLSAHEQGQLHRAFSVFIYRREPEIELLLQCRAVDKYHCGGLWTNSCCSHPQPGEATLAAGRRRLQEEMGMAVELVEIGDFVYRAAFDNGLCEYEFDHVLLGQADRVNVVPNPDEVSDYVWQTPADLWRELHAHPERYTPWLLPALEIVMPYLERITYEQR